MTNQKLKEHGETEAVKTFSEIASQIEQTQITITNDGACSTIRLAQQADDILTATRQNLCSQKWTIFRKHKKTDFKSSYFFLICDHLHNDATLGCKYSVYIEN